MRRRVERSRNQMDKKNEHILYELYKLYELGI